MRVRSITESGKFYGPSLPSGLGGLATAVAPLRWDLAQGPIAVWFDASHSVYPLTHLQAMQAIGVWQACIPGLVIVPAISEQQAQVKVLALPNPLPGRPDMCGHAQLQVSQSTGWIHGGSISVVVQAAVDARLDREQRTSRLRATLSHEMGHVLGLSHVIDEQSLMHPQQGWRWTMPSAQDAAQCRRLYGVS